MQPLKDVAVVEANLQSRVVECLNRAKMIASQCVASLQEGLHRIDELRRAVYEDLNQLQHEALLLHAARFLQQGRFPNPAITWSWNPQQTGTGDEPDLRGADLSTILVSAEATGSARAVGKIRERMIFTLTKLNSMPGQRLYFVRTASMQQSAQQAVARLGFDIEVVCLTP
jgi:hypothetical protein